MTSNVEAPKLLEFSNNNLLKFDCHDQYITVAGIRKQIVTTLSKTSPEKGSEGGAQPIDFLPGLQRIGKAPKSNTVYLAFDTAERQQHAREVLSANMKSRSQVWEERPVTNADLSVTHKKSAQQKKAEEKETSRKRKRTAEDDEEGEKKIDVYEAVSCVAPWSRLTPDEQIERKHNHCQTILQKICALIGQRGSARLLFQNVIRSPKQDGYRNHVNLTCAVDEKGNPIIGFNEGGMISGMSGIESVFQTFLRKKKQLSLSKNKSATSEEEQKGSIEEPKAEGVELEEEGHIKKAQKKPGGEDDEKSGSVDAEVTNNRIEEDEQLPSPTHPLVLHYSKLFMVCCTKPQYLSSYPFYDKIQQQGFWRRMQVRHNIHQQVLIDFEINMEESCFNEDEGTNVSSSLPQGKLFLQCLQEFVIMCQQSEQKEMESSKCSSSITSVQFHCYTGKSTAGTDIKRFVYFGSPTLSEALCGLKFELSPTAFFQVNTEATELLLNKVAHVAKLSPQKTVLLDLCCGTGTIGLCLAKNVERVIGVEIVSDAIENAKINAKVNQIGNTTYYCGKVEEILMTVLQTLPMHCQDVVAILDPPRCGVHHTVIKWIRSCAAIHRVVYISCEQQALVRDGEGLIKRTSNQYKGEPFRVSASFGVDLFPQTPHVEMIAVFERSELNSNPIATITDASSSTVPLQENKEEKAL